MMEIMPVDKRPPRVLVGVFPRASGLAAARRELAKRLGGNPVGTLVEEDEELLSVMVPWGRQEEIVSILKENGATMVGEPAEFQKHPHPGLAQHQGLKLPEGGEYPEIGRTAPPRAPIRVLRPEERINHFDEINQGFPGFAEAWAEANRCLQCPKPRCREGCPAKNDIPGFIGALLEGDPAGAVRILRRTSNFPGICGRVCDWPSQCEGACILGQEGNEPVAIGALERFLADWELAEGRRQAQAAARRLPSGKMVAVVGSGPSGLAAAQDLALAGHGVTVYEELPIAGGALAWGIPTFRLPQHVLQAEIDYLPLLGVELKLTTRVGEDVSLDELLGQYDAVFLGVGTTVSTTPGLPGEDLTGVYTATEFLARTKLSQLDRSLGYELPDVGGRLAVFGAGNTAMDVAQTALRLGAESKEEITDVVHTALRMGTKEVMVIYRRSAAEMPARREEVASAREEGVEFRFLTAPVRFVGDGEGHLRAVECVEMELGEPDSSGRRRPIPIAGSEFTLDVDTAVLALGYRADTEIIQDAIPTDGGGLITVRGAGRTGRERIWAGGDIVSGPATVVGAMAAGKRVARDMDRYLRGRG